jgi:hypothetical protein
MWKKNIGDGDKNNVAGQWPQNKQTFNSRCYAMDE